MQVLNGRPCALARPTNQQRRLSTSFQPVRTHQNTRFARFVARAEAEGDSDDAFEQRLAKLKTAKGATPIGESRKEVGSEPKKKYYDFSDEVVFFEGQPAVGDLAVNVALGATLLWLPLTAAAIGRFAFVRYKFTDKRLTVTTKAPWQDEQIDVAYQEVSDVVAIGRGIGAWGDMVVTLKNGDKVEIRSLERWQELKNYILERKAALSAPETDSTTGFL
ncbi:hypothetical protein BSKO_01319 [Bryopsis sp. KO-2023]|nr:hypothetical protein BSKO_01319 [Bryopsis sp. KO-2023]